MLVTTTPQFEAQNDLGEGTGIVPTLQWQLASTIIDSPGLDAELADIEPEISIIFARLRSILHRSELSDLTSTDLHDLTCYVIHRLLLAAPSSPESSKQPALSESLRLAMVLFMLDIHGTTYYSHDNLSNAVSLKLRRQLAKLKQLDYVHKSTGLWIISVGLTASPNNLSRQDLIAHASSAATSLDLHTWEDVAAHLESVLWVNTPQADIVRQMWNAILKVGANELPV